MFELFKSFDTMHQVYWVLALVASFVFVVQSVITFCGFDSDSDFSGGDGSFDSDGFSIVSIKTVVCFILGFGWSGVLFYDIIASPFLLGLMATGVGLVFMALIALLLHQMSKIARDNTFRPEMTIGQVAEVYLRIPAAQSDSGKILVSIDGSLHELEAMTLDPEDLPTGSRVRIVGILGSDTVLVSALG